MSIDLSNLQDDIMVWAGLLPNILVPLILPMVIGLAIGGFVLSVFLGIPLLLKKMKPF